MEQYLQQSTSYTRGKQTMQKQRKNTHTKELPDLRKEKQGKDIGKYISWTLEALTLIVIIGLLYFGFYDTTEVNITCEQEQTLQETGQLYLPELNKTLALHNKNMPVTQENLKWE